MQPGGRPPAPAWLRLLQDFVNTYDIEAGQDSLDSQERLHDWLKERGLIGGVEPVTDADLGRTLDFREALRELLLANGGEPIDPSALDVVNAVASGATLTVRFLHGGGAALEPAAGGIDGALGRIVSIAFGALLDGSWARLKACRNETCQWAFYDRSKNRSGAWCTMSACGNRMKARAFRKREGGRTAPTPT